MHGADAGAGKNCNSEFRDHSHIYCNAVTFFDSHFQEYISKLAHFAVENAVGKDPGFSRFSFPDDGCFVPPPRTEVPVEAVISNVCLSADKPLGVRSLELFHPVPVPEPMQFVRNSAPEFFGI